MLCVCACRGHGRCAVTSAATANEVMMVMAVAATAAASATASRHQGYADGQIHIVVLLLAHLLAVYGTVCPVNLGLLLHLEVRGTCRGVLILS